MSSAQLTPSQSIVLDVIRYILASVVVVGHGLGFFLGYFDGFFPRIFPHPQSIAVVCFFYLSGFLIVGSQLRQSSVGKSSLGRYLFDRISRIYVTLIPSLVLVVISNSIFKRFDGTDALTSFTNNVILLKNFFLVPEMPYGTIRPIWSLMYEWWIYMLFGGIWFVKSNRIIASALILGGSYYVFKVCAGGESGHIWILWMVGGICAYLQGAISWGNVKRWALCILTASSLLAAGVVYFSSKDAFNVIAGVLISVFIFLFANLVRFPEKYVNRFGAVAKRAAGFSFTLFLTHYTVLSFIKYVWGLDGWAGLVSGFFFSNVIAYLIASVTELRLVEVKGFFYRFGRSVIADHR